MPRRPERSPNTHRVDLHGYDVLTATGVALDAIADAYANGYSWIELLHGAADVRHPVAPGEGRGGIKWELRRMLERGNFDSFISGHELMEGMMRLRLRPNPRARPRRWRSVPPSGR